MGEVKLKLDVKLCLGAVLEKMLAVEVADVEAVADSGARNGLDRGTGVVLDSEVEDIDAMRVDADFDLPRNLCESAFEDDVAEPPVPKLGSWLSLPESLASFPLEPWYVYDWAWKFFAAIDGFSVGAPDGPLVPCF